MGFLTVAASLLLIWVFINILDEKKDLAESVCLPCNEVLKPSKKIEPPVCAGNIEITELDMGVAGWEGRLWVNTYGKALGLAVRRIDQPSYFKFWGGSYTEWGRCSPWSNHSMGGYCLVDEFWLTDKARRVYRMYADPHIYDALP